MPRKKKDPLEIPGLETAQPISRPKVKFHHAKGNYFRVVHADGLWGSVSSNDNLHVTFYNERWPIPSETVHEITDGGELAETSRVIKDGYFRELEVDVVMSRHTAMGLYNWLTTALGIDAKNITPKKDV